MTSRFLSLILCVLLVVNFATAKPQTRAQRLTPQQQQLLLQQQQRQRQQQSQQQSPRPVPGSLLLVSDNLSLSAITDGQLQRFLSNDESVKILTDCFIAPRQCTSKPGINLIKQVRSLGLGGRCKTCKPEEQAKLHEQIYVFVQGYQTRYPDQWRRVLPHLGTLITAIPTK